MNKEEGCGRIPSLQRKGQLSYFSFTTFPSPLFVHLPHPLPFPKFLPFLLLHFLPFPKFHKLFSQVLPMENNLSWAGSRTRAIFSFLPSYLWFFHCVNSFCATLIKFTVASLVLWIQETRLEPFSWPQSKRKRKRRRKRSFLPHLILLFSSFL